MSPESAPRSQLPSLFPKPAVTIAIAAFVAIVPMLFFGTPSGHDFEFHLDSWIEVLGQWRQGIAYPRWAELAHWGYGEARFLFYPPISWALGAALGSVLPWRLVPGAFNALALFAAGCSMFFLARRWMPRADAIFAAALYAANPYHLVIVYWRSAYAELLVAILLPLLLLYVLRAVEEAENIIIPLALIVAAAWLTDAPAAVMVNYSLALLIVVAAVLHKAPRLLLYGAAAVILGAALAAFYLVPAAYEQKWVNIAEVLSPGVRPQDNFLFTTINDTDHNRFNLIVSTVACVELVVVVAAAVLCRRKRREQADLWWTSVAWTSASAALMFSFTFLLWQYLPKLRFVQLPWRWLLCLNAAGILLVTLGWRRWISRALVTVLMIAPIVVVWHRVQTPWWDHAEDIAEIRDSIREGKGYEGTDEYVPAGADPYELKQGLPRVTVEGGTAVWVHVQQWGPESKIIDAEVRRPAKLILRLLNYPAWKVTVNGRAAATETTEVTGQMIVPIPPGSNRIRVVFSRTWDRTIGAIISLLSALTAGAWWYARRGRLRPEVS